MFKLQGKVRKEINTYVGTGTVLNGNILCQGCIRIDGKVKGDLNAEGDILIGKSGEITGNVSAKKIVVGGAVEGNIISAEILRILSTAKLTGDINVNALIADRGGLFNGRCNMFQPPKKVLEVIFEDWRQKDATFGDDAVNA